MPIEVPDGFSDLEQEVYACVERSAAAFAAGPDAPEEIAKAVRVKCQAKIIRFVEQEAAADGSQPLYDEALAAWEEHALPVIAEARAKRCFS